MWPPAAGLQHICGRDIAGLRLTLDDARGGPASLILDQIGRLPVRQGGGLIFSRRSQQLIARHTLG